MSKALACPKCRESLDPNAARGQDRIICGACGAKIRLSPKPEARLPVAKALPLAPPPVEAVADPGFEMVDDPPETVVAKAKRRSEPNDEVRPARKKRPERTTPERPKSRKGARGAEPSGSKGSKTKLLVIGGGVLGLLFLVSVIVGLVFLLGGKRNSGGDSAGNQPAQAVAKARPAMAVAPPKELPKHPLPTIDAATWKVKADPIAEASDLKSAFAISEYDNTQFGLDFADPAAGKALITGYLKEPRLFDLRTGAERTIAFDFSKRKLSQAAIAPSGTQYAMLSNDNASKWETIDFELYDAKDDRSLGRIKFEYLGGLLNGGPEGVYFASDTRVVYLQGNSLRGYDLPAGEKPVFATPVPFLATPRLTPGRKFIYGQTEAGFEFFDTGTGQSAGVIKLDPAWPTPDPKKYLAGCTLQIDRDGNRAILGGGGPKGLGLQLATFELANGKVLETAKIEDGGIWISSGSAGRWVGDSLILLSLGYIVDWETKKYALNYKLGKLAPLGYTGYAPDRRDWFRMTNIDDKESKALWPTLPKSARTGLISARLPYDEDIAAIPRFGSLPWPVGTPLRIESQGDGDASHHNECVESAALAFSLRGFPIDPNSPNRVAVVTGAIRSDKINVGASTEEIRQGLKTDPNLMRGPNVEYSKNVQGLRGDIAIHLFDGQGKKDGGFSAGDVSEGSDRGTLLQKLRGKLNGLLSPGTLDSAKRDKNEARAVGENIPVKIEGLSPAR